MSAPRTMPPWKRHPTMVVPVLVALGTATPFASRKSLRTLFEKSNPAPRYTEDDDDDAAMDKEVKFDCASHKQRTNIRKWRSSDLMMHTFIGMNLFALHQIQTHTAQHSSSHSAQRPHTRSAPRSPWVSSPAPACAGLVVARSGPSSHDVPPRCPTSGVQASHTVRLRMPVDGRGLAFRLELR